MVEKKDLSTLNIGPVILSGVQMDSGQAISQSILYEPTLSAKLDLYNLKGGDSVGFSIINGVLNAMIADGFSQLWEGYEGNNFSNDLSASIAASLTVASNLDHVINTIISISLEQSQFNFHAYNQNVTKKETKPAMAVLQMLQLDLSTQLGHIICVGSWDYPKPKGRRGQDLGYFTYPEKGKMISRYFGSTGSQEYIGKFDLENGIQVPKIYKRLITTSPRQIQSGIMLFPKQFAICSDGLIDGDMMSLGSDDAAKITVDLSNLE